MLFDILGHTTWGFDMGLCPFICYENYIPFRFSCSALLKKLFIIGCHINRFTIMVTLFDCIEYCPI